jgi:hypothetical protein
VSPGTGSAMSKIDTLRLEVSVITTARITVLPGIVSSYI